MITSLHTGIIMRDEEKEPTDRSEPREVRVGRINRRPGTNKAIISLAVLIILVALFIIIFLRGGF
ncbi:MAG TPA: hypothetical protein VKA70_04925 [Blastocatellia bacterium]|nr:hypothetical protein [Blastocatellia bacterium]